MTNKVKMLNTDSVQKFLLENRDVRGVIVRLTESYQAILKQHNYSAIVQQRLGEVLVASALLVETIKLNGRMTIQFQSEEGAIQLLVAQINSEGHLRGLAQWNPDATDAELSGGFGKGELVITIFQKGHERPMQGIVSLENRTISEALTFYFLQSEQLPTTFSLSVTDKYAVGMLLQLLPEQENFERKTSWELITDRIKEINAGEIFYDNNASFLTYYFPEDDIRLFDARELKFQCGCSVEKMENAIYILGEAEANAVLKEKPEILVTCEYCNHEFGFDREKVEAIFRQH
ncbi:MAG: Hsp33 family molecular chaperone HslO [Gammaproteobacteria bacterium]|nr:Hsp33 family molecular chaperone HslO [Gammaproteobacteria bacterium]